MKIKYLHVVLLVVLAAFVCTCQSATTDETHAAAPTTTDTEFIATGSSASFSATPTIRSTPTAQTGHATSTVAHTPTPTHTLMRPSTATPIPTQRTTTAPTVAHPIPTPTPAPKKTGVNGNPFGYDFTPGSYIYNPPGSFCGYFACISTFWQGRGYVVECQDMTYSKSGGISGSCSHHGGNKAVLYAH